MVISPKIDVSNAICYRVLVQRSRSRPASGTTAALRRTSSTLDHSNKSHRYIIFFTCRGSDKCDPVSKYYIIKMCGLYRCNSLRNWHEVDHQTIRRYIPQVSNLHSHEPQVSHLSSREHPTYFYGAFNDALSIAYVIHVTDPKVELKTRFLRPSLDFQLKTRKKYTKYYF
jgi:hypothetical protein